MKKKEVIIFIIVFLIAILSTASFLEPHYSIDTIEFLKNGYEAYVNAKFLRDGRIFSAILLKFVIEMPMKYVIPVTYIIGIIISCITVMYLKNILIKYKDAEEKTKILPTVIAYVIIFNFMYLDAFQFLEFPIIAISILLYIISAKLILENKKFNILKSIILTIIAIFCYQGTVTVLLTLVFVLSIIKNRKINKIIVVNVFKSILIVAIATVLNYIFTKIFGGTSRISYDIITNIIEGLKTIFILMVDSGYKYPLLLQLIFMLIISIYYVSRKKEILNIILIYLISMFSPIILLAISSNYVQAQQAGRIFFSVGATIGYILMYIWCTMNEKSKIVNTLIIIYFITIIFANMQYTYYYMKGHNIDKYLTTRIEEIISEYENKSGIKIKKYAYKVEKDSKIWNTKDILDKKYTSRIYYLIGNGRRTKETLSIIFKIYANDEREVKPFEEEIYNEYFLNKEFNGLNEERFIFIGDTVYFVL